MIRPVGLSRLPSVPTWAIAPVVDDASGAGAAIVGCWNVKRSMTRQPNTNACYTHQNTGPVDRVFVDLLAAGGAWTPGMRSCHAPDNAG